jgi:pimeloyl-ACP methyl ester carboxylesterase
VGLHTWSADYLQLDHYKSVFAYAKKADWVFVGPNFRGPNKTPQACGSDYAVQDIIDAVNYAKAKVKVDPARVYIIGGSGGGHMTLLMLGRHPEVFAAGAAFCPISDVARWHGDSLEKHPGRETGYAMMLESACGGTPTEKPEEYRHRSPLTWLARAKEQGVPAYVCTGIHDGWKGSVPVGHSFRAFNALADEKDRFSEDDIAYVEANQSVPEALAFKGKDPFYDARMRVHLRRTSGCACLTIFEGGHGGNFQAGFDFLSRQRKGHPIDWTLPATGKGANEALAR